MLHFLLLLGGSCTLCYSTVLFLHLTIGEDLLSPEMLLLHCPESFLLLLCLFKHLSFFDLKGSLVHYISSLLGTESLEVVWLYSVRCKHRLLSLWILGHKIVCQSKVLLMVALELSICVICCLSILLLLCKLAVCICSSFLHCSQCISFVFLCFLEQFVKMKGLGFMLVMIELCLILVQFFLSNLLLNPVFLL